MMKYLQEIASKALGVTSAIRKLNAQKVATPRPIIAARRCKGTISVA